MAKIAFLLLVHKDPERVIEQARALTAHGDGVAIHIDARAGAAMERKVSDALKDMPGVIFARRVKCGWGEYSLVQATLNLVKAARRAFDGTTHYFLISGDCCPTKSRGYIDSYLTDDTDIIETHDFFDSDWIKTGLRRDRLIYRHWFNERQQKWLFYTSLNLQRRFGLDRALPKDLRIRIGSQWWCLRAGTIERILNTLHRRADIARFFRTTWIPDETFFQTLAAHVVPEEEIRCHPPTSLLFSDYGMPVVFHNDHHDFLRAQNQPFARKISPHALELRAHLLQAFGNWEATSAEGGSTPELYAYLTGRGRGGQRYQRRFWERAIGARRDARLLIVAAKLWHVGQAFERAVTQATGLPGLGYLFDEDKEIPLDLGNLERGLYKRNEHRHALMNLVFEALGKDRVVLAVDPARTDVIDDLSGLSDHLRILLVERPLTETHIRDHAERAGLIGAASGRFEIDEALRAVRHEFGASAQRLRDRYRGRIFLNQLDRAREDNVTDIGHFLEVPRGAAEAVARNAELYTD